MQNIKVIRHGNGAEVEIFGIPMMRKKLGRVGIVVHCRNVLGDEIDDTLEICPLKQSHDALQ